MSVGIVVALPEELGTLTSRKLVQGQCAKISEGIWVALSGTGPNNARSAAEQLIRQGVTVLMSWGCAAGLSDTIRSGDLLIPDSLLANDLPTIATDSHLIERFRQGLEGKVRLHRQALFSCDTLIATTQAKRDLFQQTQAVALDMESYFIADVARQAGVICLVVRSVADTVDMSLPTAVVAAIDAQGQVDIKHLLLHLLMRPMAIPELVRLGLRFNRARQTLKIVAKQLHDIDLK